MDEEAKYSVSDQANADDITNLVVKLLCRTRDNNADDDKS